MGSFAVTFCGRRSVAGEVISALQPSGEVILLELSHVAIRLRILKVNVCLLPEVGLSG